MVNNTGNDNDQNFNVLIVGAGPNGTYAMERLAAEFSANPPSIEIHIHVVEKTGHFGAGWVHSPSQPKSSMLNRIVGQVAFACDETNIKARNLLNADQRPDFAQWCQRKYQQTGEAQFNLGRQDWPPRYLHGMALVDMFDQYCSILSEIPKVNVHLHHGEVLDVEQANNLNNKLSNYQVTVAGEKKIAINVDHILFVTGHSNNKPRKGSYAEFAQKLAQEKDFVYVPFAYPLEQNIKPYFAQPSQTVGCLGLGLTAIDVFLYLTEGRGGEFKQHDDGLGYTYQPCGNEPTKIVAFSQSGLFTHARPFNAKEDDPEKYEHKGVYLTEQSVDQLRASRITHTETSSKKASQLDFERDIFPLVHLEMALLYYKVMFGTEFEAAVKTVIDPVVDQFLSDSNYTQSNRDENIEFLYKPLQDLVESVVQGVEKYLQGAGISTTADSNTVDFNICLVNYLQYVFGLEQIEQLPSIATVSDWTSPFGHPINPRVHLFNWENLVNPISTDSYGNTKEYKQRLLEFMHYDHQKALQGNLLNPEKAACDGVWRDLRQVFAYAADFGGFTPDSHRVFNREYMRYHNRLANGTCIDVMEKMIALINADILDIASGPNSTIEPDEAKDKVVIASQFDANKQEIDCLVDARLHELDIRLDTMPLYRNLYEKGFIKSWSYPSDNNQEYIPGGIEITKNFHPINNDGNINASMTFLGPVSEGVMFFQVGAARPQQDHHVLNDIIDWFEELETQIELKSDSLVAPSLEKSTLPEPTEV